MNERQRHALLNPLQTLKEDITPYRTVRAHARGFLLMAVLAVDR